METRYAQWGLMVVIGLLGAAVIVLQLARLRQAKKALARAVPGSDAEAQAKMRLEKADEAASFSVFAVTAGFATLAALLWLTPWLLSTLTT